jgi:hypothetical protein
MTDSKAELLLAKCAMLEQSNPDGHSPPTSLFWHKADITTALPNVRFWR